MAKGPLYGVNIIADEYAIANGAIPVYRAVCRDAVDATTQGRTCLLPASATTPFFGAANNLIAAASGDQVHVIKAGRAIGTAGAAVSRGAMLKLTTAGKLVTASADKEQVVGIAEEDAGADGDFFTYTIRVFTLSV